MFFSILFNLVVLDTGWTEDCATTNPDWGAGATSTGATCTFLSPRFLTTATDFIAFLCLGSVLTHVGLIDNNGIMHNLGVLF